MEIARVDTSRGDNSELIDRLVNKYCNVDYLNTHFSHVVGSCMTNLSENFDKLVAIEPSFWVVSYSFDKRKIEGTQYPLGGISTIDDFEALGEKIALSYTQHFNRMPLIAICSYQYFTKFIDSEEDRENFLKMQTEFKLTAADFESHKEEIFISAATFDNKQAFAAYRIKNHQERVQLGDIDDTYRLLENITVKYANDREEIYHSNQMVASFFRTFIEELPDPILYFNHN